MFATWNGLEHEAFTSGNSGFDVGTGNLGYGNAPYGINGMNGMNGMDANGNPNGDGNGQI